MKKITVALITFSLGLFVSYLLNSKPIAVSEPDPIQYETPIVIPDIPFEKPQELKPENLQSFFKSFKEDEGYSGWFIADDFKGMPEVWTILLVKHPQTEKFQWTAMVLTNLKNGDSDDDADFSSLWVKTENNKLSFKTKKYRNVEYKFEGEFFKNGSHFEQEEKVLKGTMQKFVRGKKVAEFTSEFAYFEPRCFH